MKLNSVVLFAFLALLIFVAFGCDRPNRVQLLKYKRLIEERRQEKDKSFKFSPNSPISETERWAFKTLSYYPVDPNFQVEALFVPNEEPLEFEMQTSLGVVRNYLNSGKFTFTLNGQELHLQAYQEHAWLEDGRDQLLFVPFTDGTTGLRTYGAGRYLDVTLTTAEYALIDFNLAYNPYCAYNKDFSCPIPPPENLLPVSITAGETYYNQSEGAN